MGSIAAAGAGLYLSPLFSGKSINGTSVEEPLFDWSLWQNYRETISHPCLTLKPENISFAHENIRRYGWAEEYAARKESYIRRYFHLLSKEFLEEMIEETTPGDPLWTPCPSCRDKGKPVHPHGLWTWIVENPGIIRCDMCGVEFPNSSYPEEIIINTSWGRPQKLSYCGGDPFVIFGYKNGRPSFSANIRSRKVRWIANYCHTLAEGYMLTRKAEYAIACKNILSRFADCYPYWLVHEGYGEFADMDPRIASQYINNLPEPEICPPPNEPDKKLWTGFWSAGRASGVGLESDFIRKVVSAYDLTCTAKNGSGGSIYSENDRKKIEKDLLLESTILLVCDKQINNKSVSNRTAVALVGMCVGHPLLMRFGLEGFNLTVNGWFQPDGTTSESPFYGLMTIGGIWDMAHAAKGYSDPTDFKDDAGKRIDRLDLYHGSPYHKVWDALFKGLQGDLRYPPYADSFRSTNLDVSYVELMSANYPDRPEYLALLKKLCGNDLALHSGSGIFMDDLSKIQTDDEPVLELPYGLIKPTGFTAFSFYYRKPGLENVEAPDFKLPDWCPPDLRIGHLRTGTDGMESLLTLSASDWGIHHEQDSLNLYYWKRGSEILSDPGYLWDHPLKPKNIRTLAHNTVIIDEKDQRTRERKGEVLLFKTSENVKLMEMASSAYIETSLYRRTSAIIDHGYGQNYVVDFFRVEGGEMQDYVFHAVENKCEVKDLILNPSAEVIYDLANTRSGDGSVPWKATWKSGKINCNAFIAGQPGERVFIGDGWGQRDWKNSDIGATVPYIVRRSRGKGLKTFISVFEGSETDESFVRNLKIIDQGGIIEVETMKGFDYILSSVDSATHTMGKGKNMITLKGHFAAVSMQNGKIVWRFNFPASPPRSQRLST